MPTGGNLDWEHKVWGSYVSYGNDIYKTLLANSACGTYQYRAKPCDSNQSWKETDELYIYAIPINFHQSKNGNLTYGFKVKCTWQSSCGDINDLVSCSGRELLHIPTQKDSPFIGAFGSLQIEHDMEIGDWTDRQKVDPSDIGICSDGYLIRPQQYIYRNELVDDENVWHIMDDNIITRHIYDSNMNEDWYIKTEKSTLSSGLLTTAPTDQDIP